MVRFVDNSFIKQPILNSPYEFPTRHWELNEFGQPTEKIVEKRRPAQFITPVPKPKRQKGVPDQISIVLDEGKGLSTEQQQYDANSVINGIRGEVDRWRMLPDKRQWHVTPETARLLKHWRHNRFSDIRPFFCQIEAIETLIWLTEVAPKLHSAKKKFVEHLVDASREANPNLRRLALKLATGSGKTTVMAMIIAWQTINAIRHPKSKRFTRGFLVVAPGITIRDRLRVLMPNDPDSYYKSRELVPPDLLAEINRARIVITNYHAFKHRERVNISSGGRKLLQGRRGNSLETIETDGQMLQRVMPELIGIKNILAINDEAHHCYREKQGEDNQNMLKGEERKQAEKNKEAARLWISGLEILNNHTGISQVVDLSATPYFLSGSGYAEGTLFPWTASDYSLMDAIESGIVKLPRVPVSDDIPGNEIPKFRNLWEHIGKRMPKRGIRQSGTLDPLNLPTELETALQALYGHYKKTFDFWHSAGIQTPPCFIIVCNNTSTSKLVYDYVAGFYRDIGNGKQQFNNGRLELFRNFTESGERIPRPRTLLIDSEQIESGESLDKNFREIANEEIDRFRREIIERTGDRVKAEKISDEELLREVMNTVGKPGRVGDTIRCVVSVSMLTEGWDANTVTHVLGIRAFGTQLLCEQVVGRALRRQSYELNDEGLLNAEYADVFGIPFDFTAKPWVEPPKPPRVTIHVKAMRPERDSLEIRFPRVVGYRVKLPEERISANFSETSRLKLSRDLIGPRITKNAGIVGEGVELGTKHLDSVRDTTILYHLTSHLLYSKWRDIGHEPKLYLFGQLKRITKQWLDNYLICEDDHTFPAQVLYQEIADMACERITTAIVRENMSKNHPVLAMIDPYNPIGSTFDVNFNTTKTNRYQTDYRRCHVNWALLDSDWEGEFCRIAESHPRVRCYIKNHNLGFEIPYRISGVERTYIPDFIVLVNDSNDENDPLHLVVEIKGIRGEDARHKEDAVRTYWIPGVNFHRIYGRWNFLELRDVSTMQKDFENAINGLLIK